jgi:regulator of nucleoside diphosphate kinase
MKPVSLHWRHEMNDRHELFISAHDAEGLAAMLGSHRRTSPFEAEASEELADLLMEARRVAAERLPADRVAMGSIVTYLEESSGVRRTVTLAYPQHADAAQGRISVLSPIGLALIGRKRGSLVTSAIPNGRQLSVRILDTVPNPQRLREAA